MSSLRPAAVVIAALLLALGLAPVRAEAETIRVILSHVPVLSNWGPTEANGVVLISYAEGDVRADLVGLPRLAAGEHYGLWLWNSATGASYALAQVNAVAEGTTYVDQLLPEPIPDRGWDYVLVTVENASSAGTAPSERIAIVGSLPGTPAEAEIFPPALPQTGLVHNQSGSEKVLLVAAGASLLGLGLVHHLTRRALRGRRDRKEET